MFQHMFYINIVCQRLILRARHPQLDSFLCKSWGGRGKSFPYGRASRRLDCEARDSFVSVDYFPSWKKKRFSPGLFAWSYLNRKPCWSTKQRAKQLWKLCVQIDVVIVPQLKLYEVEKRLLFHVHEWIKWAKSKTRRTKRYKFISIKCVICMR